MIGRVGFEPTATDLQSAPFEPLGYLPEITQRTFGFKISSLIQKFAVCAFNKEGEIHTKDEHCEWVDLHHRSSVYETDEMTTSLHRITGQAWIEHATS